jgi:sensor c-di-GMP phosphodiesterase-like protein
MAPPHTPGVIVPIRIKNLNTLFFFLVSVGAGIAVALLLAQLLWAESSRSRVDSYAQTLLVQSEAVAKDLSSALAYLNAAPPGDCGVADLVTLKKATFEFRFIKDAGRLRDGAIICSAMWGPFEQAHQLGTPTLVTRNDVTLWLGVSSYAMPGKLIDVSFKGHSFTVTSPTAFATFEEQSTELAAVITSADGTRVMRRFGDVDTDGDSLARRQVHRCSTHYDICVTAQADSSIFGANRAPLLLVIVALGAALGTIAWIAVNHLLHRNKTMAAKLAAAIEADAIGLLYQPIVRASTGALAGFEALARWHDKELGEIRPDIFVSKAAEINMTDLLNRRIIARALRECAARLKQDESIYLSINLDIAAFLDPALIEFLLSEALQHGVAPRQIALELLEGATTDIGRIRTGVAAVRALGIQVFIDDFGTGYSGLAYLGRLDVDKIKIDRIFTQSAGTESAASMILTTIFGLAEGIGTGVVFEGVETAVQLQAILELCPDALVQGWYYSRAVAIKDVKSSYG